MKIKIEGLKKYFPVKKGLLRKVKGYVKAVDDISFLIPHGSAVAIVGESGSGKTTVGKVLMKLLRASSGKVFVDDKDILPLNSEEFRSYRKRMQFVFQDPYTSLNPRMSIKSILQEPLKVHSELSREKIDQKVLSVLSSVGLNEDTLVKYPHEFSGGQLQRISIARSLILSPEFFVFDEPVSALDVSIQAQLLNLIKELQVSNNLTYLFISHDLAVVKHIADETVVMYAGKIVEKGKTELVFSEPSHPYTKALLASAPNFFKKMSVLAGEIPPVLQREDGCPFYSRCKLNKKQLCLDLFPSFAGSDDHSYACHLRRV